MTDIRRRLNIAGLAAQASRPRRGIQIGPRIRVGGTLGKIGEGIKQNLGQVAKIAAVPASFINPGLGVALAAGGRALHTNEGAAGLGDLAGAGLKNYATGAAGRGLMGLGKRALGAVGGLAGGGMPSSIPGEMTFDDAGHIIGQGAERAVGGGGLGGTLMGLGQRALGASGGAGGLLGSVGGFLGDHGADLAMGGLAAEQAIAAAKASARSSSLSDKALALAESRWSDAAPLRAAGTTGLLTPKKTDLSGVYTDPSNPFAAVRRPVRT